MTLTVTCPALGLYCLCMEHMVCTFHLIEQHCCEENSSGVIHGNITNDRTQNCFKNGPEVITNHVTRYNVYRGTFFVDVYICMREGGMLIDIWMIYIYKDVWMMILIIAWDRLVPRYSVVYTQMWSGDTSRYQCVDGVTPAGSRSEGHAARLVTLARRVFTFTSINQNGKENTKYLHVLYIL